ncbi:MAG: hypothetical protein DRN30_05525 [Thermoplasmata archaeon]|nr:MAG: hypothetical protein DRN30_05525 [Thermoplasmata archaeon]
MHKEEIIQIHRILYIIAEYMKRKNLVKTLDEYESSNTRPFHVNKSKEEHLVAIFLLSKDLLQNLLENDGMINTEEIMITIHAINNLLSKKMRNIRETIKEQTHRDTHRKNF